MNDPLAQSRSLFFQGIEHSEAGRNAEACAAFQSALGLAPGRPSILANLGITLVRLSRCAEAIPILQQAEAADPGKPDVLVSLGLAYQAEGEWHDAAATLTRALQLAPRQPDLWLACGLCQLRSENVPAALQAFDKAIELAPDFAPAWSERGSLLRELKQYDEAARCFEKAIELGADPELHAFYLAAVKKSAGAIETPRRYVESLFDDYAAEFEDHLVGNLKYQGYALLVQPLLEPGLRYPVVLDLGCGTGLCGKLIHSVADCVDGVDLSSAMLVRARESGSYRNLVHAEIGEFLAVANLHADLILAADVFGYVRDLQPIFQSIRRILNPGGCFAFTVELPQSSQDIELLPSLRHAHSEAHVRALATSSSFKIRNMHQAALRQDQTDPINALYVYLE